MNNNKRRREEKVWERSKR